jgi:hypothetical protein
MDSLLERILVLGHSGGADLDYVVLCGTTICEYTCRESFYPLSCFNPIDFWAEIFEATTIFKKRKMASLRHFFLFIITHQRFNTMGVLL